MNSLTRWKFDRALDRVWLNCRLTATWMRGEKIERGLRDPVFQSVNMASALRRVSAALAGITGRR